MAEGSLWNKQFVDDRGWPTTFRVGQAGGDADAQAWADDPLLHDLFARATARRVRSADDPMSRRQIVLTLLWTAGVLFLTIVFPRVFSSFPVLWVGVVVLFLLAVVWNARFRHDRPDFTAERRATFLASGRCAACGYRLEGTPPSAGGMTACPECNAAWRTSDIFIHDNVLGSALPVRPRGYWATQFVLGPVVGDGRKRLVRVTNIWGIDTVAARASVAPDVALRLRSAGRAARRSRLLLRMLASASLLFIAFTVARAPPVSFATFGISAPWIYDFILRVLFTAVICFFYFALIWRLLTGRSMFGRHAVVAALLRFEVCPSCGIDLSNSSVEPDACVVCPRCRAAWLSGKFESSRDRAQTNQPQPAAHVEVVPDRSPDA